MNKLKKLLALVLALAICATFALPALAGENQGGTGDDNAPANGPVRPSTVTNQLVFNNANSNHTYEVYQILAGDVASGTTGELTLANIKWGSGIDKDKVVGTYESVDALLQALPADADEDTVNEVAKNLISVLSTTPETTLQGSTSYSQEVNGGYYLIVDKGVTEGGTATDPDYISAYIMQIVGTTAFTPKITDTTFDKDIIVDPTSENVDYVDAKGFNIGDTVTFSLQATVPVDQLSKYDTYKLQFNDTMSEGLTFTAGQAMKLKVSNVVGETATPIDNLTATEISSTNGDLSNSIAYKTGEGNTVSILIPDLFTLIGGSDNIPATGDILVEVTYTAVLNSKATVYPYVEGEQPNYNKATLDFSNDPNNDESHGTTPPSEVYPFTFKIDGLKVDGNNNGLTLAGAIFQLKDKGGKVLSFVKVTDGDTVRYIHYGEDAFDPTPDSDKIVTSIETTEDGKFVFEGLEDGEYTLVETQAPAGYNKLDYDLLIKIKTVYSDNGKTVTVTHTETQVKSGEPGTESSETENVGVTIQNNEGSLLPSTGGIGTTIFYIVGAVLVVGAGVLLFTKRRAKG